ncbi:MAG: homocysteine S-methyltransferase family protein [Candidatus Limnocylindrales bacterium]
MTTRCLLLAGSWGPERLPARPARDDADWVLPLHVRDEAAARERIAAQVAAGADVVVAPTWLTHRRALLPLAETRRAADWTTAAVRVARDAVEVGLERREALLADAPPDDVRQGRPDTRVAAVLPVLHDQPDAGSGRLPPHESASLRDYRDQAGLLADAAPDLLLVEAAADGAEARTAGQEACATGLPVWAAHAAPMGDDAAIDAAYVETWLEWGRDVGLERLLLPTLRVAAYARGGGLAWGGLLACAPDALGVSDAAAAAGSGANGRKSAADWLAAGASALACLDGASAVALEPLRAAIDEVERVAIEASRAVERRWHAHVARAARMALGGPALWLGERAAAPLPEGFAWLHVDATEAHHLPTDRFRLIVARRPFEGAAVLLERGGVLASGEPLAGGPESGLRTVLIDDASAPPLAIYRREP